MMTMMVYMIIYNMVMMIILLMMMICMMICKILMILRTTTKMISGLCCRLATRVFCVLWMFFHVLLCVQARGARGGLF